MVCCIVLKPTHKRHTLLLSRRHQLALSGYLEMALTYKPFIFNSINGVYIFVKKKESFEKIEMLLHSFPDQSVIEQFNMYNAAVRPQFFRTVIKKILHSKEISALGWKRFINSFLLQIDPYDHRTSPNNITVFEKFCTCIRFNGNKHQRKFFKNRLKILRERVSLEAIEKMLRIE